LEARRRFADGEGGIVNTPTAGDLDVGRHGTFV